MDYKSHALVGVGTGYLLNRLGIAISGGIDNFINFAIANNLGGISINSSIGSFMLSGLGFLSNFSDFGGVIGSVWLAYYGGLVIGSMLPDADMPYSVIGLLLLPISLILYITVGHRTVTHSILAVFFVLLISLLLFKNIPLTIGLSIGYLMHLILDMFSRSGVPLLYPVPYRFKF